MNLKDKYLNDAAGLNDPELFSGVRQVGWRSPSNIALVKYWGKRADQIPQNASLSFTLGKSYTETKIEYLLQDSGKLILDFQFEGKPNMAFEKRINFYLTSITPYLPFLNKLQLRIESENSFPHSSGIASSASSMSALALCLVQIEKENFGTLAENEELRLKASFLARLGSGSAARSVYGGFVEWGETDSMPGSSDEIGIEYPLNEDNSFLTLNDAILITSREKKEVSSTSGHGLMESHPYAASRYQQAQVNMSELNQAIRRENDDKFVSIIENEALSLHALMMSSNPGYTLMNPNTWNIVNRIREFRTKSGMFLTFTLDAGPNVHLIYKNKNKEQIAEFIHDHLLQYCDNGYWIDDLMGTGPEKIN